ncbi:aldehyde dehydrogenase family protein [Burkholderia sp. LMG 32019]|uniref:aldehyde dehydrogenase family protein n=1 Tax=Burkholderia sp. LMG 32019 TaxID=3158173 RepID=UPI003C2D4690
MRLERPGRGVLRASRHSRLFRERTFGTVLSVTTFIDIGGAIALANDSVYTGALNHTIRLSRDSRAGVVTGNGFGESDVTTPFGGYKASGFGGHDKSVRDARPVPRDQDPPDRRTRGSRASGLHGITAFRRPA